MKRIYVHQVLLFPVFPSFVLFSVNLSVSHFKEISTRNHKRENKKNVWDPIKQKGDKLRYIFTLTLFLIITWNMYEIIPMSREGNSETEKRQLRKIFFLFSLNLCMIIYLMFFRWYLCLFPISFERSKAEGFSRVEIFFSELRKDGVTNWLIRVSTSRSTWGENEGKRFYLFGLLKASQASESS